MAAVTQPADERVLTKGPAQVWRSAVGAALPSNLNNTADGKLIFNTQTFALGGPASGDFILTHDGASTSNIAFDADAATIQTALEGLSTVLAGNVAVSGSTGGPFVIDFIADLGWHEQPLLEFDDTGLVGGSGASMTDAYEYMGMTNEGVNLTILQSFEEITVDQFRGAIDDAANEEGAVVDLTIVSSMLEHWTRALRLSTRTTVASGASQAGQEVLKFGDKAEAASDKKQVFIYGRNNFDFYQLHVFWRMAARGDVGASYKKGDKLVLPVQYKAFTTPGKPLGNTIFTSYNMTLAKTS